MVQQISTNTFGTAKFIVSPTAHLGTNTTIQEAINAAVSGQTVFVMPGTYTENITLKAGVNLTAYDCDATTPNVTIVGTSTATFAGTCSISGIRLQTNGSFFLAVTGASSTHMDLTGCYLNCTNNTGISFTSSVSSSAISLTSCRGNLATTGITCWDKTSPGAINLHYCELGNTGNSITASSNSVGSVGIYYSSLAFPLAPTSTGSYTLGFCQGSTAATNVTFLSLTGTSLGVLNGCTIASGTASPVSVGAGCSLQVDSTSFSSSNASVVTGAGTTTLTRCSIIGGTGLVTSTTLTPAYLQYGIIRSTTQPAFLATHTVAQDNVTGAGATVTVNFTTEVFDQGTPPGSYDGINTFTAQATGRYFFSYSVQFAGLTAGHNNAFTSLVATSRTLSSNTMNIGSIRTGSGVTNVVTLHNSCFVDMNAGDTAIVQVNVSGGTPVVDLVANPEYTWFSGHLVC
jgi:hypothetical protein